MKIVTTLLLCGISFGSSAQLDSLIAESKAYQDTLNAEYADAETSPLMEKDLKDFVGLDFFPVNMKYRVIAKLVRTPESKPFKMKTTTSRTSVNSKYGDLIFEIAGEEFKLEVYQDHALMKTEEYADYLFLPFLDKTNGEDSYGGGRYIGLRVPESDEIEIDFNKAYNPYCAYNANYSCPLVPRNNRLKTRIEAGVKAFKDH